MKQKGVKMMRHPLYPEGIDPFAVTAELGQSPVALSGDRTAGFKRGR